MDAKYKKSLHVDFRDSKVVTVTQENVPCGTSGVTCTKSITVYLNQHKFKLESGTLLELDGVPVDPAGDNNISPGVMFYTMEMNHILFFKAITMAIVSDGSECISLFYVLAFSIE